VPEPSAFEFELAIEKIKSYKSRGIYQIPTEFIKAKGRTIGSEIYKLFILICSYATNPSMDALPTNRT